jgi:hypothetical protein
MTSRKNTLPLGIRLRSPAKAPRLNETLLESAYFDG